MGAGWAHRVTGPGALLEREFELECIDGLLTRVEAGSGGPLIIEGEPGIGKSTLIDAAAERATERGIVPVTARGSEMQQRVTFGVARELAIRAPSSDVSLSPLAASAYSRLIESDIAWGLSEEPAASLIQALYWFASETAEATPLLLLVDDAHWADAESLAFIEFGLPRFGGTAVGVLLACRPLTSDTPTPLARISGDPSVELIRPRALTVSAVEGLLARELSPPEPGFAAELHRVTGGNAFFVTQIARALAERNVEPTDAQAGVVSGLAPSRVARWLAARLSAAGAPATKLARATAVLGDGLDLRVVAAVAGLEHGEAEDAASKLARASILGDVAEPEFAHPIIQSSIYESLGQLDRGMLHRRAGRELEDNRLSAERVAAHWLLAPPANDPEAVAALVRAADLASRRGGHDAAARYLRRAIDEPPRAERRPRLLAMLGEAELHQGEHAAATSHLREALSTAIEPEDRAFAATALARTMAEEGRFDLVATMLDRERGRLNDAPRELLLGLEGLRAAVTRIDPATASVPERLIAYRELRGDTRAERELLATLSRLLAFDGTPVSVCVPLAERAVGSGSMQGEDGLGVFAWQDAFWTLWAGEKWDAARRAAQKALDDARVSGAPIEFFFAAQAVSQLALTSGDLALAQTYGEVALEAAKESVWASVVASPILLAFALLERGELAQAELTLNEGGLMGDLPPTIASYTVYQVRAGLRLAQGRHDEAVSDLRRIGILSAETKITLPIPQWRSTLALALRETDRDEAEALAAQEVELAERWGARGILGQAQVTAGLVEGGKRGLEALAQGVSTLSESPRRLEYARALVEYGGALRRGGHRRDARSALETGLDLAHRADASRLVTRALEELKATGARPRRLAITGIDALTPMERRIAGMAASGISNREIAQALFVTRKNVEMHLSHVYAKLEISSRKELPAQLAASVPGLEGEIVA